MSGAAQLVDLFDWALDGEPLTTTEERELHRSGSCRVCGFPLERQPGVQRVRQYCTLACEARARAKAKYNFQARCVDCGAPCRKTRCQRCSNKRNAGGFQRKWTRDDLIAAMRAWIDEHGKPPTWTEWTAAKMKPAGRLYQIEFGSWSAGVDAARSVN